MSCLNIVFSFYVIEKRLVTALRQYLLYKIELKATAVFTWKICIKVKIKL